MTINEIGAKLAPEDQAFLNEYKGMYAQYGVNANFPLTEVGKQLYYDKFVQVLGQLSPEELETFNAFTQQCEMQALNRQYGDSAGLSR